MAAFDTPLFLKLPAIDVICLVKEQRKQNEERELWRRYMANVIPLWGGKDVRTYEQVLADFKAANEPARAKQDAIKDAKRTAEETLRAFNQGMR